MSRIGSTNFQAKRVIKLECRFCDKPLCARAMKANLLADRRVELFSTDYPSLTTVQSVGDDYKAKSCFCRITDVACLGCGNVVGYHVTSPCTSCLSSCNNGHFWMFYAEAAFPSERLQLDNPNGVQVMLWASIPDSVEDIDEFYDLTYEECCR